MLDSQNTYIFGISGGSGSGKTTYANMLIEELANKFGKENCGLISQDNYYIDQSHKFDHDGGSVNFDHPNSIDFQLLSNHLLQLKDLKLINIPIYKFDSHTRSAETIEFKPCRYIVLEGTLILTSNEIIKILNKSIFIQTDEALRFERRKQRDLVERGRTLEGINKQFFEQVAPMHNEFVEPSKSNSTVIIENSSSLEVFRNSIKDILSDLH